MLNFGYIRKYSGCFEKNAFAYAFYEELHRGNKKCRANTLPSTVVRLDHPDRNDIIFGIYGRQFGAHAEDGAIATRNGRSIQQIEGADQLAAGIDRAFNL